MKSIEALVDQLHRIDGRGYRAYKDIVGSYEDEGCVLHIDHVQGDPFAEPSRVRVVVSPDTADLPEWAYATHGRRVATADFLNRQFAKVLRKLSGSDGGGRRGSGRSGEVRILRPGQEVLQRTSLVVRADGEVEARFWVGLPAQGRKVMGRSAATLLADDLADAIDDALLFEALDADALKLHLEVVEDAHALRAQLQERELVGFVANGAILPRCSGVDDRPLDEASATPFQSPPELEVTLEVPNRGEITGMGVPHGVTLIVGGGFHGKSTLLRALERGIYAHIPGDGREYVATVPTAVKVRAEDGRAVSGTDISNFIGRLPGDQPTEAFRTENASGSTSQAAGVVEALEVGATCLLIDEDTSATNFMIRDARMQALVSEELEPITPFIDRARFLAEEEKVSTVLVVGGSGDYFDVADTVIAMHHYKPAERTAEAKEIMKRLPTQRVPAGVEWRPPQKRAPLPNSIDPSKGRKSVSIKVFGHERALYGEEEVRMGGVEQLVEDAQLRAIAETVAWARGGAIDGKRSLYEALRAALDDVERDGLEIVQRWTAGNLAEFRIFELAAFVCRLRSLKVEVS